MALDFSNFTAFTPVAHQYPAGTGWARMPCLWRLVFSLVSFTPEKQISLVLLGMGCPCYGLGTVSHVTMVLGQGTSP